jgi:hypothetical protein
MATHPQNDVVAGNRDAIHRRETFRRSLFLFYRCFTTGKTKEEKEETYDAKSSHIHNNVHNNAPSLLKVVFGGCRTPAGDMELLMLILRVDLLFII